MEHGQPSDHGEASLRFAGLSGVVYVMDDPAATRHNHNMTTKALWGVLASAAVAYVVSFAWTIGNGLNDPAVLLWGLVMVPAVAAAGVVLLWKRPHSRIGHLLVGVGLCMFVIPAALEGPTTVAYETLGPQSWVWASILANKVLTMVAVVLMCALVVLLPDGKYSSVRERKFVSWLWPLPFLPVLSLISNEMVIKYSQTFPGIDDVSSPYTVDALLPFGVAIDTAANALAGTAFFIAVPMQIARYRKAPIRERKQVRWVIYAIGVAVAVGVTPYVLETLGVMDPLGHTLAAGLWSIIPITIIPASVVVAVLEPKWVDVDIVIRKSFVYGALSFVILLLYVSVAAAFGVAAGSRMEIEIAVVLTVVIALLFQPARQRLQVVADRWVFGQRPSKYEAVTGFSETLERSADPRELLPHLVDTIQRALDLEWATATLDDGSHAEVGNVVGSPAFTVSIGSEEDRIGSIECGPKVEGSVADDEVQLVRTLAGQVGLALINARLAGRIVNAAESERRRIERNIHDGAQQELVALVARLGMARASASKGELGAEEIEGLQQEAQRILGDLRDLAQGIHPSVLSDGGILEAVEERCATMPIDVTLKAPESLRSHRFADDIEGAAYFFVTESLANVLKHSEASSATVTLTLHDGSLILDVADNGKGFEPSVTSQTGLDGLRDRLAALGGTLTVSAGPGKGARTRATLPAR
ncbi:MAG: histidine kinase [Acidimicrobiia bacterium]|nr:histidine kinase [Acidimicrobiia bacterium]